MKINSIILYLFAFITIGLTSCGPNWDHYDMVPEQTKSVVFERPGAWFHRNAGGSVSSSLLETGKRNHGDGIVIRYDVDMSIQEIPLKIDINMRDNINQDLAYAINFNVIGDDVSARDLVLNYLPIDALRWQNGNDFYLHTSNEIGKVNVPLDEIYKRHILPFFDMVARDRTDEDSSIELDITQKAEVVKTSLINTLEKIKIPKTNLDENGQVYLSDTEVISILDVISINSVIITNYDRPEELIEVIRDIEEANRDLKNYNLKMERIDIERRTKMKEAQEIAKRNLNIKQTISRNPNLLPYRKMKQLEEILDNKDEKRFSNMKLILKPKNSTVVIND